MAWTVSHISDKAEAVTFRIAHQTVHRIDDYLDQINVPPLVATADIVRLRILSFMENQVDRAGMILDIKPVADILPCHTPAEVYHYVYY